MYYGIERNLSYTSVSVGYGETLVKSLLQHNSMIPTPGESAISPAFDAGILRRPVGKKDLSPKTESSFQDIFMQAVSTERPDTTPKASSLATPNLPTKHHASSDRLERDLTERRNSSNHFAAQINAKHQETKKLEDKVDGSTANAKSATTPKSSDPVPAQVVDRATTTIETKQPTSDGISQNETKGNSNQLAAAGTGTAASAELRPLKLAVGGKGSSETMVGNNAVLSFLTGRLDRLSPESIPSIISDSPFVKQALSASEISDLMQLPMGISELSKFFEIDQSVMNKAAANGLDASLKVTPKEFLAALGVDPGLVVAELSLLQQRLPVEGAASYIERAKAMAAAASNKAKGIATELGAVDNAKGGVKPLETNSKKDLSTEPLLGSMPPTPLMASATPGNLQAANASPSSQQISSFPPSKASQSPSSSSKFSAVDVKSQQMHSPDQLLESLIAGRLDTNLMTPVKPANEPQLENFDGVSFKETSDPYASLGLEMKSFQVESQSFAPTTVAASMGGLEEQLTANGFIVSQNAQSSSVELPAKLDSQDKLFDADSLIAQDKDLGAGLDTSSLVKVDAAHMDQTVHEISSNAFAGGFSQSTDQSFDGEFEGREQLASDIDVSLMSRSLNGPNAQKNETFISSIKNAPQASEAKPDSLHSKILQHATMMLKDGGGSMRMDFQTGGMGKIDLAINLSNNQLDVRILTPNEQTRDIINNELSGLRDGLGQKGISLRNVEVGNASQTSQHFTGQNFTQGRNGQQASYNEMKEYAKNFANSFNSPTNARPQIDIADSRRQISSAWMNTSRDSSRIAVRI